MNDTITFRDMTYRIAHFGLVSAVMERKRPGAYWGEIPADELARAIDWLRRYAKPAAKKKVYSYTLKHIAEAATGDYIGNGTIILAALWLGYRVDPEDPLSPNAWVYAKWSGAGERWG